MQEIKRIKNITLARVVAVFYAIVSFLVTIVVAISAIVNIITQGDFTGSIAVVIFFNLGGGVLLGLVASILIGSFGWIIGYISAVFYNLFARKYGGLKVEIAGIKIKDNFSQLAKEEKGIDPGATSVSEEEVKTGEINNHNNLQ